MSYVTINGTPKASFEFINLPSRNIKYKHWTAKSESNRRFRTEACYKAHKWLDRMRFLREPRRKPLVARALIVVNVYVSHEGIMDIHNVDIKAVTDGLVDGGIFQDDEWAFVPLVIYRWAGIDKLKRRRTVIDIYELEALVINDESQVLPLGRKNT